VIVRKRRSVPTGVGCGVLLFCSTLMLACSSNDDRREAATSTASLMIGVSEGTGQSREFGLEQLIDQITTENLTGIGVDGRALPRLAKSWSWERDERRLRLKLRDDVLLHDGRRFDSQLAAEALAIAIGLGAPASYVALRDVTAAIPDGPFDLLLDLSRRSALLPEDLTVLVDIPAGPYRPVDRSGEAIEDEAIELERFEDFYLGTPSIPRVVLRPFDTLRESWASLLRGELDVVYDVSADAVEFVNGADIQMAPVRRWYQYALGFNARSGPLRSPVVRRALNMAVDRDRLVRDVLYGAGEPSSGPLWPSYWAADASIAAYSYDPDQAEALLDAAGFPLRPAVGAGPSARFSITALIPEDYSEVERIALHVQKNLFNIGVDLQFKVVPLREFGRLMNSGEFEASLLDMISGPTPGRAYMLWASAERLQGVYNVFGYENDEAERLFETLLTTRNEAAVRSATRRLQRVMHDDPPALFLAWSARARAIRRNYQFPQEPGVDPMFTLWRWTRRSDTLAASAP
jgi:peptide/nickel transport system substrate-binding protein